MAAEDYEGLDPDLDPDCTWTGGKGGRSIEHITECVVCASIWPQIANHPMQASLGHMMMQAAREQGGEFDVG